MVLWASTRLASSRSGVPSGSYGCRKNCPAVGPRQHVSPCGETGASLMGKLRFITHRIERSVDGDMSKVGGHRNYGYGKRMDWAGKNALKDRYGSGHYATRAAHEARWRTFVSFARENGNVRDARHVTSELIENYGRCLAQRVRSGDMKVAYAQNLISTVNVVMESLRHDRTLRVSPATFVGNRTNIRQTAPAGLDRLKVEAAADALRQHGHERVASLVELARDFGLRFREASLLDVHAALKQANQLGRINVTEGTKGGRGHSVDRWVPVTDKAKRSLESAAGISRGSRNLIPMDMRLVEWRNHADTAWQIVSKANDLSGFHDLRAAYACERYQQLTGQPAPIVAGHRAATREIATKRRGKPSPSCSVMVAPMWWPPTLARDRWPDRRIRTTQPGRRVGSSTGRCRAHAGVRSETMSSAPVALARQSGADGT